MADPSVHVWNGRLYIYPSHDRESGIPENDNGDHFDMNDYHVFSTDDLEAVVRGEKELTDHGVILRVSDIPWAGRQLWDCDTQEKDGKYSVVCTIGDMGSDVFRMELAMPDKLTAEMIKNNFIAHGSTIYPKLMDTLTQPGSEDDRPPAALQ